MKIDALRLSAFGPFADKTIDFSGNEHGLHIVFGVNEAGKSTALRAILALLYGFGHKVEDAWLHDYSKLEVGGALLLPDDRRLNLTRFKRRKNDLIDDDTGEPYNQTELDTVLGKMSRQAFEHAFGISHISLRQGVDSVLAAGGELGHALFAATSGLNILKQVMSSLDNQQDQLFKPRAQKAAINAGISELDKLNKELRNVSASQNQWKQMKTSLDKLLDREIAVADRLQVLSSEISLLSRHHDALKHVTRQSQLKIDLDALGPVPDLADDFAQRRVETQTTIKAAVQAEQDLKHELKQIDEKLKTLTFDDQIIAHTKEIEELAKDVSVHTTAIADCKRLSAEIHRHNESAQKDMSLLRDGLTLDGIEAIRLSTTEKAKIQRLGAKYAKLEESLYIAGKAARAAQNNMAKARVSIDKLEQPKDTQALEDCLERTAEQGKIEQRLSYAETEFAAAQEQAEVDLSALGLWSGDLRSLEELVIPTDETMRSFETNLSQADQTLADIEKEGARLEKQLKDNQKTLSELNRSGDLPSLEDLKSHRALRDRGWRSVRAVWLERGEIDQGFMEDLPQGLDLAGAYEKAVYIADDTSDRLRTDAEAVTRVQAQKSVIQDISESLAANRESKRIQQECRAVLLDGWRQLWEPLGIVPLNPRDMATWASRVGEIKRKAAECRAKKMTAAQLRTDIDRMRCDIAGRLKDLSVSIPEKASYSALFELAKRTKRGYDQLCKSRQELEVRITAYEQEIDENIQRKDQADQDIGTWVQEWIQATNKLGLDDSAKPEDANDFVLALDQVFGELEKAKDKQQRIAGMQYNYEGYTKRVKDTLDKLAPDRKPLEATEAVVRFNDQLAKDKARYKDRKLFEAQRGGKSSTLSQIKQDLAAQREKLRLLCEDAQTEKPDQLPEIEKQASVKSKLLSELDTVNERLAELASGQELKTFVEQIKAQDPDELVAKLGRLEDEKKGLYQEQKQLVENIALQKKELEMMGGDSIAAGIAETAEGLTSKIQSDVEHYIKLKLSSIVLANAIERYRQINQSPVLEAASGYFKTITGGVFEGLKADYDEKGEPVIKAFRPDGTPLMVQEMSDGSRDQLFLALRLGGLDKYVSINGPMPFIVDDVLVHFDDDRSAAAFNAMGKLAENTQIIFFTHHQHLVELAKTTLEDKILKVHNF